MAETYFWARGSAGEKVGADDEREEGKWWREPKAQQMRAET